MEFPPRAGPQMSKYPKRPRAFGYGSVGEAFTYANAVLMMSNAC